MLLTKYFNHTISKYFYRIQFAHLARRGLFLLLTDAVMTKMLSGKGNLLPIGP
jgi:hypothetical protein